MQGYPRKKEAEQDAARQALLELRKTQARRPQALPATLRLPSDLLVQTMLERYLPEALKNDAYDVLYEGCMVDRDVPLGHIGSGPLCLELQLSEEW